MDHKTFLKGLDAELRRRLSTPSDRAGLAHLAVHWGLIGGTGLAITAGVPGWWLLVPVQGVLIVFLFTLLHETVHLTPFRTRWLNLAVGWVCGAAILIPPLWFRYFHLAHHRHTQDPAHDPELAEAKPVTRWQYLRHISGLPAWRGQIRVLLRNAAGRADDPFLPVSAAERVRLEARTLLLFYAGLAMGSAALGSAALLWAWIVPAVIGQPALRLYLLAEHGRCPQVANMFENTRTTFTSWLIRKLAWNMPYHAEHHAMPTVPFHRLPELHRLTAPHLKETERGYRRFHRRYLSGLVR